MGATGLLLRKKYGRKNVALFGILNATRLHSKVGRDAGFVDQGKDDVRISVATEEAKDIVFQFRLNKGSKEMTIRAYDPNIPSKATVEVKTSKPSLDSATGDVSKLRDMMNRSRSGIKESSLGKIADELVKNKNKKGRK